MPSEEGKSGVRTLDQVSAGGVAYRLSDGRPEIALIKTSAEKRWQLPKGLIDEGETPETAALREVREEAGIDAELIHEIEKIEYWYYADRRGERVRYHKFVHFYLMKYLSGDVADHDHEVDVASWVPLDEAVEKLAFKSERDVVTKAAGMISRRSQPGQPS